MVLFGRRFVLLFAAIGAVQWLTMARIVRGQVLSLRRMEFIEAAVALGLSKMRIIFRHMIPNALGPIIVYATLTVPSVMLLEAFLISRTARHRVSPLRHRRPTPHQEQPDGGA